MYKITQVLLLVACCLPGHAQETHQPLAQIAMVALKFVRTNDSTVVSLHQAILIESARQRVSPSSGMWSDHDFVCVILDDKMRATDTCVVHQPLRPRYEYAQEDGTLESTAVPLEENVVILRFPYSDQIRYLQVYPVMDSRFIPKSTILPLKFHD